MADVEGADSEDRSLGAQMSRPAQVSAPVPYGGEAVIKGVMMKGATAWSLAVRTAPGSIHTEVHPLAAWMTSCRGIPLVRGVIALATSMTLGIKSMQASMRVRENQEKVPFRAQVATAVGVVAVLSAFLIVPVLVVKPLVGTNHAWALSVAESVVRLLMLIGYIASFGFSDEVRDVFRYHSAEHEVIAAHESGQELTPENVSQHPAAHPRCGTAFLLLIVLIGTLTNGLIGTHSTLIMAFSRIVSMPLIVGLSYELLRGVSRHPHSRVALAIATPGLALQRLTTRPTSVDHIEIAIAAMNAVVEADNTRLTLVGVASAS